jgi:hypothetical protein
MVAGDGGRTSFVVVGVGDDYPVYRSRAGDGRGRATSLSGFVIYWLPAVGGASLGRCGMGAAELFGLTAHADRI